jgi:hypothetical protein
VFCRNDAIVFHLAHIVFADSLGEVHFIPKKASPILPAKASLWALTLPA